MNSPDPQLLPFAFAREHGVMAHAHNGALSLWMRHGADLGVISDLQRRSGKLAALLWLEAEAFARLLEQTYRDHSRPLDVLVETESFSHLVESVRPELDLLDHDSESSPTIRLVNGLFIEALRLGASDIHLEPYEKNCRVRFRMDGMLASMIEVQMAFHAPLVSRIKVMAGLDIAEKRLPQDGRISLKLAGRSVDVRVSTLPTEFGERLVLRLLDKHADRLDWQHLGLSEPLRQQMDRLIHQPHGIVLVTGPTGSGKTTTLYASLSRLDVVSKNVLTVEDPVEYELAGIGQTQVNSRIELSFARALRSILRQDPDIIMIGEIRDLETAQIAIQASLTGHLVLATLHTNHAVAAINRLVDMGIPHYLVASSLLAVLAQRLLRRLCQHCRVPYEASAEEQKLFASALSGPLYRAHGCEHCRGTGYRGRVGIFELLVLTEPLQAAIHQRQSDQVLTQLASGEGFHRLGDDGLAQVASGATDLAELWRVNQ